MNQNERDGAIDQVTGKIKQAVGTITGDAALHAEGQADETIGKVESAVGKASHQAGDTITRIGDAVKKGFPIDGAK
jgi:uncharacterized protein YjbJ (UPF0337 family)